MSATNTDGPRVIGTARFELAIRGPEPLVIPLHYVPEPVIKYRHIEIVEVRMNKEQAITLRESGLSIREIAAMGISKSTASVWCRGIKGSDKRARTNIKLNAARGSLACAQKWSKLHSEAIAEAISEWALLKQDPNFMEFIGIYWGEGDKRCSQVGISNTDPALIRKCMHIFERFTSPKYDCTIMIYPDENGASISKYWSEQLHLSCPIRIIRKESSGKRKYTNHGTAHLRFSDWRLKQKLMAWIECTRQSSVEDLHLCVAKPS